MSEGRMGARDWGLLILLSLLWGAAFILTEVALRDLPPFTVVLGRIGLAALALNLFLLARGQRLPFEPRLWAAFFAMGALNNVLPFSLIVTGQVTIDGGLAAVLNATTPLFSLLIGHFITRAERLNWHRSLGIALGILGVVILTGPQALRGLGAVAIGQFLVLAAALSYACAAVFGRRFAGRPPVVIAGGQLTASTLLILPLALVIDRPWTLAPGVDTWAALLVMAVFGTAAAYVIYFRVLASAGATNLMLVTLMIPVSALALGMALLGERPAAGEWAGAACILGGLLVIDGRCFSWRPRAAQGRTT
ncbi:MAG: DMT family transporter [Kiloniellales bacterium]|nr:DMT family transporter [Kiloniellales bacterium]